MENMAAPSPGDGAEGGPDINHPVVFIDKASSRSIFVNITRDMPFNDVLAILDKISSEVATAIKGRVRVDKGATGSDLSTQRFNIHDRPYLYRFIKRDLILLGNPVITCSSWYILLPNQYHLLFDEPQEKNTEIIVEIQHALQFESDAAIERREATRHNMDGNAGPKNFPQPPTTAFTDLAAPLVPFFFIDNAAKSRYHLLVTQNTVYDKFTTDSRNISSHIALQIKPQTGARGDRYFTMTEGRWIGRIVNLVHKKRGPPTQHRSDWFVLSPTVFYGMLGRVRDGTLDALEIQHTRQDERDTGVPWVLREHRWSRSRGGGQQLPPFPPPPPPTLHRTGNFGRRRPGPQPT